MEDKSEPQVRTYIPDKTSAYLNDLWKFNLRDLTWVWVSGNSSASARGVYGVRGQANSANLPGARIKPSLWSDSNDDIWLFGGYGKASASTLGNMSCYESCNGDIGNLNDLWKFSNKTWTWISGANLTDSAGNYSVKNISSSAVFPASRYSHSFWRDSQNKIWIFGGCREEAAAEKLRDLWTFNGVNWTWVSGDDSTNVPGIYGSLKIEDPANIPGSRDDASVWTDARENLWMFGGRGFFSKVMNSCKYSHFL